MCQVRQDCHKRKGKVKVRASKATVDTWATRCMVSRARNTVEAQEAQEAWAADTTNLEDRIIKQAATELTGLGTAQDSMETAIVVDGVPTMGTKVQKSPCFPVTCLFTSACTLLSGKWY